MENENLSKVINEIIQLYYKETNTEPIAVKIEFVQDLYKRKLELAIDEKDRKDILLSKEFTKDSNGTIVIPKTIEEVPYILVSMDTVENAINNNQFISTITHELTHIHDFYNFYLFNEDKCNYLRDMENCNYFNIFTFWTEYNARRKGYYFYRKVINIGSDESEKEQIEFILYKECSFHMNYLKEELSKYKNNTDCIIYYLIQFVGRFSVWNDLFPSYFNVNTLPNELLVMFGNRIVKLYEFLYKNKDFNDVKFKFNEFDYILSKFERDK